MNLRVCARELLFLTVSNKIHRSRSVLRARA